MLYDKLEHLLLRTTIIQNILIITPKVCVLTVMIWSCNNNKLYYLIFFRHSAFNELASSLINEAIN